MSVSPGSVIVERYRLVEQLGAGGMGVVWAAESLDGGQEVAIKLMKSAPDNSPLRRRFLREARAINAIEHPNVVRVLDVLELDDGAPALVMERLFGETLAARIGREGALPLSDVAHVMLLVVSAVGAAHARGIIHRDLKPENIFLIQRDDGTLDVKVLDFGIAKLTLGDGMPGATTDATATGAFLGTPAYMSPEQVFGEKDIDHRTDAWSIGMILYESLSGVLPTRQDNVGQIIKTILTHEDWRFEEVAPEQPDDVKALVGRLLQRARLRRPSLREVAAVLGEHTDVAAPSFGEPANQERTTGSDAARALALASTVAVSPTAPARRINRKAVLGIAVAITVIGAGAAWLFRDGSTPSVTPAAAAEVPAGASIAVPLAANSRSTVSSVTESSADVTRAPAPSTNANAPSASAAPRPAPMRPKAPVNRVWDER